MLDETKKDVDLNSHAIEEVRPYEIKQIEINMIAASFGGLGTNVVKLHQYVLQYSMKKKLVKVKN